MNLGNVDMDLYNRASQMVAEGKKKTEAKQRRCMKCAETFSSKGDRVCEKCSNSNKRYGKMMNNQYEFGFGD